MDLAYRTVILVCFKFSDDGGPNLIELIKQMLVPHFTENIFPSGFILVSSNDIITIKINNKRMFLKTQEDK